MATSARREPKIEALWTRTGDVNDSAAPADLPDPSEGPIVLFDGVCNFCAWSVRFIYAHDDGSVRFAPLQSEAGRRLLAAQGLPRDYFDSLVYIGEDGVYTRSDGAVRIARHLEVPWRWLWALRVLPRPLRDVCYDLFGRVRYRLFGRKDACMVPDAALRARFVGDPTA
jgi:predicted DCC family thiol-disulfide oxidoreductase YuxK